VPRTHFTPWLFPEPGVLFFSVNLKISTFKDSKIRIRRTFKAKLLLAGSRSPRFTTNLKNKTF
jgi:hypothetical protein